MRKYVCSSCIHYENECCTYHLQPCRYIHNCESYEENEDWPIELYPDNEDTGIPRND